MPSREEVMPYYKNFCWWLGIHKPHLSIGLQNGMLDSEQLKPYVREWATDIYVGS